MLWCWEITIKAMVWEGIEIVNRHQILRVIESKHIEIIYILETWTLKSKPSWRFLMSSNCHNWYGFIIQRLIRFLSSCVYFSFQLLAFITLMIDRLGNTLTVPGLSKSNWLGWWLKEDGAIFSAMVFYGFFYLLIIQIISIIMDDAKPLLRVS